MHTAHAAARDMSSSATDSKTGNGRIPVGKNHVQLQDERPTFQVTSELRQAMSTRETRKLGGVESRRQRIRRQNVEK